MNNIYIAGIAMTVFGRHLERSLEDMAGEALQGALKDAGCQISDIGTAYYAGITNGPLQGQFAIPGQVVMSKIGIEQIPIFNIDNGCAAGSSAVHLAINSLKAGNTDVALALGCEKMNIADKLKALNVMEARLGCGTRRTKLRNADQDGRWCRSARRVPSPTSLSASSCRSTPPCAAST